jgi:hypothetical protein
MSAKAAAFLNFGNSPFILGGGESKDARKNKAKGVIQRGNLKPEDIGGTDVDDLESLGDTSNAQTVFQDDDDDYEDDDIDKDDDDVSRLSEEEYEEGDNEDEKTVNQDYGEDSDDVEMEKVVMMRIMILLIPPRRIWMISRRVDVVFAEIQQRTMQSVFKSWRKRSVWQRSAWLSV